jgi:predicted GTPase
MMATLFEKIAALPQTFQGWLSGSNSVNMLVTGKTGVGKSSLINGVVGKEVAEEGDSLDRGTVEVQAFAFKYHEVDITIWDSPGLQDDLDKEEEYIRDMKRKGCANSDLMLYCARMDNNRFRKEDHDAIRKLTIGLGKEIWKYAIFVMTFANDVWARHERGQKLRPDEKRKRNCIFFKQRLQERKAKLIGAVIEAGVDAKVAASIPIVPAGYDQEQELPDRDNWLSPLWYASILRMKECSQTALLKANLHRIKLPDQITPEDLGKTLHKQPIVSLIEKIGALPQTLQGWISGSKSINVLMTGKTGVGKSSLINGVFGKEIAKEGHNTLDRGMVEVQVFDFKYHEVDITIWYSPGLQDGLDKEVEYVRDMQRKECGNSDLMLYCFRMDNTRFRKEDQDAIRKLTIGLGKDIWKNAIFVMTFANHIWAKRECGKKLTPDEERKQNSTFFKERLKEFKAKLFSAVIEAGVDAEITSSIPVVPAGCEEEIALPDRDDWLSPLRATILTRLKRSQSALLNAFVYHGYTPHKITQVKQGTLSL